MTTDPSGNPISVLQLVRRNSLLLVVVALGVLALASFGRAESSARLEKHARKIQRHLAKYRAGTLVQIDFRDSSVAMGTLGNVYGGTFQIVDADNNKLQTYRYSDVSSVKKGREYIGAGSEPGHHVRRWVPLVAGAFVAGGGVAAYEALR